MLATHLDESQTLQSFQILHSYNGGDSQKYFRNVFWTGQIELLQVSLKNGNKLLQKWFDRIATIINRSTYGNKQTCSFE